MMAQYEKVKAPSRRREFIYTLKELADFAMQKREWCMPKFNPNAAHTFSDNMRFVTEFILDDGDLDKLNYATGKIGYWFKNKKEALVAHKAAKALDSALEQLGYNQPNEVYVNSPLWHKVVEEAKDAYETFKDEDLDELLKQARE